MTLHKSPVGFNANAVGFTFIGNVGNELSILSTSLHVSLGTSSVAVVETVREKFAVHVFPLITYAKRLVEDARVVAQVYRVRSLDALVIRLALGRRVRVETVLIWTLELFRRGGQRIKGVTRSALKI
jgi:hypothetical protein